MRLKTGAAACSVALGLTGVLALGTGVAQAAPYTRTPTLTVSDPTPFAGETDGVQGLDYASSEAVSIDGHSVPVHLTDTNSDAAGSFTTTVVIPLDWACQEHTIVGTGATGDSASAVVHVRCPGGGGGEPGHEHHHEHGFFHHEEGGFFGGDDRCDPDFDQCYPPDDDEELPSTGAKVAGIGVAGTALIAGGLALTIARRRRSRLN